MGATRSRSRRPRRSPPSTSPSSARSRLIWSLQKNALTSTSRSLPSTRQRQGVHLLGQTKDNLGFLKETTSIVKQVLMALNLEKDSIEEGSAVRPRIQNYRL